MRLVLDGGLGPVDVGGQRGGELGPQAGVEDRAAAGPSDGKFAGLALLKPVIVAGPPNATPAAQAVLVSADTVRDFLKANGVNASGGSDAKAAAVRVICVRK